MKRPLRIAVAMLGAELSVEPDPGEPNYQDKRVCDVPGAAPQSHAPCGCQAVACLFGDDLRDSDDDGDPNADPDADWCAEVPWARAAAIVRENERLMFLPDRVKVMETWVKQVVISRWKKSKSKAALSARDFRVLSLVVHRVGVGELMRLRIMPRFRPAFQFVMKHPLRACPDLARSVMIKLDPPVRWVEATRGADGVLSYRRDQGRVPVDMKALRVDSYGDTWAEAVTPGGGPPLLLPPDRVASLPEQDRRWCVFSRGVGAWVPARRGSRDGAVEWMQAFDPPCRVEYPILDVGEEYGGEEYGRDVGVLAPLYDGDLTRVYDRLVLHPQHRTKWIGVYERQGRLFAYSYPDDVEILGCDLSPENFNLTWCWPPCLVD